VNEKRYKKLVLLLVVFFCIDADAGQSARELVGRGNKLYNAGKYNEAAGEYEKAIVENPQSLEPKFDKANSFYMLEDFEKAKELYRKVSAESRDMKLVAKAKYNLGDCFFRQGEKQKDSNLQKAVEDYLTAISFWRQALEIEPGNVNAAKNIEVARLIIKDIQDQINKQKQQQQQQQKKDQQLQQQLKELLEKQKALAEKTDKTNQQADSNDISQQQAKQQYEEQANEQSSLEDKTKEIMKNLQKQEPNDTNEIKEKKQKSADELKEAGDFQRKSQDELKKEKGGDAKESQDKAIEKIEKAIEQLSGQGGQQSQQKQEKQQAKEPNEPREQQQQQQVKAPDTTAQKILDKEQEDKKMRRQLNNFEKQKVEMDW
jgi:Ca-activated chloride channel family protein